jgi:hypothetical protein
MTRGIANPHLEAEIAATKGDAAALAKYFESEAIPCSDVIKSISRYLGCDADDWILRFKSRNGRRPTKNPKPLWWEGQEKALSARLFTMAESLDAYDELGIRRCPTPVPDHPDKAILLELADALNQDRNRRSKWKLVFSRPGKGNPATPLEKELKFAFGADQIEEAIALHGSWEKALEAIGKDLPDAVDETFFRRAMTFLRRSRKTAV